MKRKIAIVSLVLGLAVIGYWFGTGAHVWTKTQVPVEVKDELFGTTTTEWKKEFHPGLDYVAPISVLLLAAAGVFAWRSRRETRSLRALSA